MIKISTMIPVTRVLDQCDPSGETWVKINPPSFAQEMIRGQITNTVFTDSGTMPSANLRTLALTEIWLTYGGTNLEVEITREDGSDIITFTGKETESEFRAKLLRLPPFIVNEWLSHVLDVVPEWRSPF